MKEQGDWIKDLLRIGLYHSEPRVSQLQTANFTSACITVQRYTSDRTLSLNVLYKLQSKMCNNERSLTVDRLGSK